MQARGATDSQADSSRLAFIMALGAVPAVLVADMTRSVYCSSEGLRIPLAIHRAVGQAHTAFRIAAAHRSPVERLLTLTGVYALLDP